MKEDIKLMDNSIKQNYQRLKEIREQIKQLQEEEEVYKIKLIINLEGCESFCDENGEVVISYKEQQSNRFDISAFKESYPELYDIYCTKNSNKVFRIK